MTIKEDSMPLRSRTTAEGIYGGHQPRQIALAVALGILGGGIVGGNISWAPILLAALLLHVHTRLFLIVWLATALLAWVTQAWLETVGRFLLDDTRLGQLIGRLGDGVMVALLGWDQYALVGGLASGIVLAIAGGAVAYRLSGRAGLRWPQICVRFFLGFSRHERSMRRAMAPRWLRPGGVPMALAALLAFAVVPWWLAGSLAEQEFFREFSAYNGAEVSGDMQLSLWSGDFVVSDLQIADPRHLDRDQLRIGLAKGKLAPGPLLRGHLDIEKLVLEYVRAHVARRHTAQRYETAVLTTEPATAARTSPSPGDLEISSLLRYGKSVCRQLGTLEHLIAAIERLSQAEKADGLVSHGQQMVRRRSELGARRPWIRVRQARVVGLPSGWNLGRKSLLELTDLSSNPPLSNSATKLNIVLPKFGAELNLQFALNEPGRPHTLRCSAYDIELAPLVQTPEAARGIVIESGRARLSGKGSFDRNRLDLRLLVEIESLATAAGRGLPAETDVALWNEGLQRLGAFKADVALVGPWASPAMTVDRQRLAEQLHHQLLLAGQFDLVAAMEHEPAPREAKPADSVVLQATALEPPVSDRQPSPRELLAGEGEEAAQATTEDEVAASEAAEGFLDQAAPPGDIYPATSATDEDTMFGPPPAPMPAGAPRSPAAAAVRRPLPGPINLVVGPDPFVGGNSPVEKPVVRESLLRRWTDGLRQKLTQTTAPKPESPPQVPQASVEFSDPAPRGQPASSTAANAAWYNRRWR
jgi:hypothetical protein